MATKTIKYGGFVAPENDMFKPEISTQGFPIKLFASNSPQYSSIESWNSELNQLDIRVSISEIDFGPRFTRVYSNSANLLVTDTFFLDVNDNKVWYYYKWPLNIPGGSVLVDGVPWPNIDHNFVYLTDNNQHTISYYDQMGDIIYEEDNIIPYPVFIHKDRIDLEGIKILDSRDYTIQVENQTLLITYSKPNLQITPVDACVFDLEVNFEYFYPKLTYWPFYVIINVSDDEILTFDYSTVDSQIKIINGVNTYVYSNIFTLFDYDNTYLISFRESKYNSYQAYIGFLPTEDTDGTYSKSSTFVVTVNDRLVWSSLDQFIDPDITINSGNGTWTWTGPPPAPTLNPHAIFSNKSIVKNPLALDYLITNLKPALVKEPTIIEDKIRSVDQNIAKKALPRYFLIQSVESGVSNLHSLLLLEDGFYVLQEGSGRIEL